MPELMFKVGADVKPLQRELDKARAEIKRGIGQLPGIGGLARGGVIAAGITAGITAGTKAVKDRVELVKSVRELGVTAQASAERASTLISVLQQLGIDTSILDSALTSLKSAVANHPEQFEDLGIALKNADGSARPLIDVFDEVRARLAGATKDAGTLQVAQNLLGGSYADLISFLSLTDDQLLQLQGRVKELGGVIDTEGIQRAEEYDLTMRELELTAAKMGNAFAQDAIPVMIGALDGLGQAFDTLGIFATSVLEMLIHQGARAAHALDALFKGDFEGAKGLGEAFLAGFKSPADLLGAAIEEAQAHHDARVRNRTAAAIANVEARRRPNGPGLSPPPAGGGKGRDTVADALRDRIDATREAAAATEQATRDALEAYRREKDAAIDAARASADAHQDAARRQIEATRIEQDARQRNYRHRIEMLRDEMAAREEARAQQVDAIQEVLDAERAAFDEREDVRDAERDRLNEQLRGIEEQSQAQDRAAELQAAQDELAAATAEEPVRIRSESLDEFRERQAEWVQRVADADKHLAEIQAQQAEEVAREQIEAALRAIELESRADQKAADDRRNAHEEELERIDEASERDRDATDEKLANIERLTEREQEQFEAHLAQLEMDAEASRELADEKIALMQEELEAHVRQVEDGLELKRRETEATLSELERQLQEHQRVGAAIAAAHQNITRTITYNVVTNGVAAGATIAGPRMGGLQEFAQGGAGIPSAPHMLVNPPARTDVSGPGTR